MWPARDFEIDADVAGEGHFDDGGEQAAVGAVVVGEEFLLAAELLDDVPEILEVGGIVDVGRGFAGLRDDLREDGAAEAILGRGRDRSGGGQYRRSDADPELWSQSDTEADPEAE